MSTIRALPTLLRIGAAETLAYRAEFIIWMLTTTLPLVMLGLWTSVAAEGPFQSYSSDDFIAYYLAALVVRNLTGSWVVWQINDEIRRGYLSMRLLRPIHPFVGYATTHVSAIPLRALVALPVALILLWLTADRLADDAATIGLLILSLVGAWALTFFALVMIGSLAFFLEKSLAIFDIYLGVFAVLSGYLIPLALLPDWARTVSDASPFRFMLSAPIEILLDQHTVAGAARLVGYQWAWAAGVFTAAMLLWRAGIRRFEAYGA